MCEQTSMVIGEHIPVLLTNTVSDYCAYYSADLSSSTTELKPIDTISKDAIIVNVLQIHEGRIWSQVFCQGADLGKEHLYARSIILRALLHVILHSEVTIEKITYLLT